MALTPKKLDAVRSTVPVEAIIRGNPVRININVPEETRDAWKVAAIQKRMTLSDLIVTAVKEYLSK